MVNDMTDANTAALIDHQRREDAAEARYADLRAQALANLDDRFWGDPATFKSALLEHGPDALIDLIQTRSETLRNDNRDALPMMDFVRELLAVAYQDYLDCNVEREIDRLNN